MNINLCLYSRLSITRIPWDYRKVVELLVFLLMECELQRRGVRYARVKGSLSYRGDELELKGENKLRQMSKIRKGKQHSQLTNGNS